MGKTPPFQGGVSALLIANHILHSADQTSQKAPQYPEGLGMKIWLNSITIEVGINGLNHWWDNEKDQCGVFPELLICLR